MARITLPKSPSAGRELEDFVAGLFQAAGYYVERGLHERSFTDVLELDVVATRYTDAAPRSVLVEAKGGRWGFPDLFKVIGWMQYLGIDQGGFFVAGEPSARSIGAFHQKVAPLGVSLVDLCGFRDPRARFRDAGFGDIRDPFLPDLWRYSFWVERALVDGLRASRKTNPASQGPAAALGYHDLVHDHVFFVKDIAERLRLLYGAYRDHPKLSLALAAEIGGQPFDARCASFECPVVHEALFEGAHPAVQAAFYVEHRARLAILKATIDLVCHGAAGGMHAPFAASRSGLEALVSRPSFRRFALLWQVFLWGFGGFFLIDREEEEKRWLGAQTGLSPAEVEQGLGAFDELFPLGHGRWIVPLRGTRLRIAKLVPAQFRGVGAFQRLRRHGVATYEALGATGQTRRTLIGWHNSLVRLLAG
ncbi:MAG: hypothetical protein U0359_17105 [Byssovorax sp.]